MHSSFEKAIKKTSDGITIDLEVTPGSKKTCFPAGYNPWRERIEIKLSSAAQKGKANEQLIGLIADFFNVSPKSVMIEIGAKNTKKTIYIRELDYDIALSAIEGVLMKL